MEKGALFRRYLNSEWREISSTPNPKKRENFHTPRIYKLVSYRKNYIQIINVIILISESN